MYNNIYNNLIYYMDFHKRKLDDITSEFDNSDNSTDSTDSIITELKIKKARIEKDKKIYTDKELLEHYRKNPVIKKESRYCRFSLCEKQASFGPANGPKLRCLTHKLSTDVNNRAKRCQELGCKLQPSFGPKDNKKVLRCGKHKLPTDINKTNSICINPLCKLTASFGPIDGIKLTCLAHKEKDYVNLKKLNKI